MLKLVIAASISFTWNSFATTCHQLNKEIRNVVRRRARLLQRAHVTHAITKVVAKRAEATSRAVANMKAKAKAAA